MFLIAKLVFSVTVGYCRIVGVTTTVKHIKLFYFVLRLYSKVELLLIQS